MQLIQAQKLCLELMEKHGLTKAQGWKFEWINSKSSAGRCRTFGAKKVIGRTYGGRRILAPTGTTNGGVIMLSKFITEVHTEAEVLDTILHEIAHGLTPGHGHDYIWQSKALSIGCNGKRCYEAGEALNEAKKAVYKYTGICPKCNYEWHTNKMPNGDRWHSGCARKFGGKYLPSEKIVYNFSDPNYKLPETPKPVASPLPKIPIAASRGLQQFKSHTAFPNQLLSQSPDSYKKMLDKFELEFLAFSLINHNIFESIVREAKRSNSWRTMNREVRKACDQYCTDENIMNHAQFQKKWFYESVMIGRTKWGKDAPWL